MNYQLSPCNVLLIDDAELDNYISAALIKRVIANPRLTQCSNGKEAIDTLLDLKKNNADLFPQYIFLDLRMPEMNGWQFLDEYNRLQIDPSGEAKIFILTSSIFSEDIYKASLYSNVNKFVTKPLNDKVLHQIFD